MRPRRLFALTFFGSQAVMLLAGATVVIASQAETVITERAIAISLPTFIAAMLFNTGATWGAAWYVHRIISRIEKIEKGKGSRERT